MSAARRHAGAPVALLLGALGGCGSAPPAPPPEPPAPVDPLADEAEPFMRGGESGLEAHTWLVGDDAERIESAIAPFIDNHVPIDAALRERWREHGLRIVRVPIDEVAALRRSLPIVGRIDRRWLGQAPAWSELMRGPGFATGRAFTVAGEHIPLAPGHLRLILRAWTAPSAEGPVVRAELGVQHLAWRDGADDGSAFAPPRGREAVEDEGLVFSTLSARLSLAQGDAYVITAERPDVDWTPARAAQDAVAPAESAVGPAEPAAQGPPMPEARTVGAGLLTRPRVGRDPALRVFIVLTPRVPDRFHLLP